jgi:hypothetical protein
MPPANEVTIGIVRIAFWIMNPCRRGYPYRRIGVKDG